MPPLACRAVPTAGLSRVVASSDITSLGLLRRRGVLVISLFNELGTRNDPHEIHHRSRGHRRAVESSSWAASVLTGMLRYRKQGIRVTGTTNGRVRNLIGRTFVDHAGVNLNIHLLIVGIRTRVHLDGADNAWPSV